MENKIRWIKVLHFKRITIKVEKTVQLNIDDNLVLKESREHKAVDLWKTA